MSPYDERMSATLKRLAITIVVPLLILAGGRYVLLPGAPVVSGAPPFSVFALGVVPILTASWLVEVVAFFVPRWSRLRHIPGGRARLERAAQLLALVLAAVQAFGMFQQLKAIAHTTADSYPSMGGVIVSLVGGVCVSYLAARIVTHRGLVNGFVLFTAIAATSDVTALGRRIAEQLDLAPSIAFPPSRPLPLVAVLIGLPIVAFACWVVLGRASAPPHPSSTLTADGGESAYRGAQTLVVHPWVPLPAGSLQPIAGAFSLMMLPASLAAIGYPPRVAASLRESVSAYLPVLLVLCGVLVWVAARLMNRPSELADLARRLGAEAGDVPQALRDALPTTYLFVVAIVLAGPVTGLGFATLPILVAAALDFVHALRIATKRPSFVVVWEERRASAVPVLRAALAADGIVTEVRGLSFLTLFQVFVPYAPAEILVDAADAPRATKALRHWLEGKKAPERVPREDTPLSFLETKQPWPSRRRNVALAGAVLGLGLVLGISNSGIGKTKTPKEPHTLEIVRVDDTIDIMRSLDESTLPKGIEIRFRNEPVGVGKNERTYFASLTLAKDEPIAAGRQRMRAFLKTLAPQLPVGARFAVEDSSEYDEDTSQSHITGVQSLVVTGTSILREADVAEAGASMDEHGTAYVAATLTPDAAKRFEDATGEWVNRRIAILVDDVVSSAPVVRTRIGGGHVQITMGSGGDPEHHLDEAKALANTLSP